MPTMAPVQAPPAKPSDNRFKLLDAAIRRHGRDSHALIEVLHMAQELFGFLSPDLLRYVSKAIDVPPSKVYGVATFYHFFTLAPKGRHSCTICLGTACFVKGAADILSTLESKFQVASGAMTRDGALSLSVARCLGSCGLAPVVILDGQVRSKATPMGTLEQVRTAIAAPGGAA
jgi:bidirectional [NiFe] hydrogenase diaphorase subunit